MLTNSPWLIRLFSMVQPAVALFLLQEARAATGNVALLGGITMFGTFANLVVMFGLLYKIGRYTGTNDTTIASLKDGIAGLKGSLQQYIEMNSAALAIQIRHGESLARLEAKWDSMDQELIRLRERQHDLANDLTRQSLRERERDS